MIHHLSILYDKIFLYRMNGAIGTGNNNPKKRKVEELMDDDDGSLSSGQSQRFVFMGMTSKNCLTVFLC